MPQALDCYWRSTSYAEFGIGSRPSALARAVEPRKALPEVRYRFALPIGEELRHIEAPEKARAS